MQDVLFNARGLECLEPRLLLSAATPGQEFLEPVSVSGLEVTAAAVVSDVVFQEQTQLDNFFKPNVITFDFPVDPDAFNGRIDISALADIDAVNEIVSLNIEGVVILDLFTAPDDGVRPFTETITLSDADLAILAADGNLHLSFTPSNQVQDVGSVQESVTVELTYERPITPITFSPLGLPEHGVFGGTASGVLATVDDIDQFVLDLEAGQTIRLEAIPRYDLALNLELTDPTGVSVFSWSAAAPGEPLVMQPIVIAVDGTYTLTATSDGSRGDYLVHATLNEALEGESIGGPANDDIGSAESLDTHFISLPGGGERAVISAKSSVIKESFENGFLGPGWSVFNTPSGNDVRVSSEIDAADGSFSLLLDSNRNFAGLPQLSEATWTVDLSSFAGATLSFSYAEWNDEETFLPADFTGHMNGDGVSISDDGVNWHTILNAPDTAAGVWTDFTIDLAAEAAAAGMTLGPNFQVRFQQYDDLSIPTDGRGYDHIRITPTVPSGLDMDIYRFSAIEGEFVSIALINEGLFSLHASLVDADVNVIQVFSAIGGSVKYLDNLRIPETGDYLLRVQSKVAEDYRFAVLRGASPEIEPDDTPAESKAIDLTGVVLGAVADAADVGYFDIPVFAGDVLSLNTFTPNDGASGLNNLDPLIELFDPLGAMVGSNDNGASDGRNASLTHTVLLDGTYQARVSGVGGSTGAFVLSAGGFTGSSQTPLTATSTFPIDGAVLDSPPTDFWVTFSEFVLGVSLDPADVSLNGVPATAVSTQNNTTSPRFTLPPEAFLEGLNTIRIEAGAISALRKTLAEPLVVNFTIDTTPPRIIESSILTGGIVGPGELIYTLKFDEPVSATALGTGEHTTLVGDLSGSHNEQSSVYNPATNELTVTYSGLVEDTYTLSLAAVTGFSVIQNLVGNTLDGETNAATTVPSGDGIPGGDFAVRFGFEDGATTPTVITFLPIDPRGSFAHEGSFAGLADFVGDEDRFAIDLTAGHLLSLLVTPDNDPSMQIEVELFDPSSNLIASSTGSNPAALNGITLPATGSYTLVVRTVGAAGGYTGRVLLNAGFEDEFGGGTTNDDLASAQDINGLFTSPDGSIQQAVVVGNVPADPFTIAESFETGVLGPDWTATSSGTGGNIEIRSDRGAADGTFALLMDAPGSGSSNNEAIWTVDLSNVDQATLSFSFAEWGDASHTLPTTFAGSLDGDGVSISDDGVNWRLVLGAWQSGSGVWEKTSIDLVSQAGFAGMTLGPDFKIKFQQFDFSGIPFDGRGYDDIKITGLASTVTPQDLYRVNLTAGEHLSVTLADGAGEPLALELLDAAGQVLTVGAGAWSDADALIDGFIADVTGDYFIRVVSGLTDYALVVTRDAGFAPETTFTSTKLPLGETGRVVSSIGASSSDMDRFTFLVNAGDVLNLWTTTPDIGQPAPVNTLDTFLELFDPTNTLIASGGAGGDGLNALLNHTASLTGTYTVRVSSELSTRGGYVLHTTGQTGAPPPFTVTFSTLFDGKFVNSVPTQVTLFFSDPIRLDTLTASDLTINGVPLVGVTIDAPDTLTFDLPAGLIDGAHDLAIAGGELTSLTGDLLEPFAARFTIDTVAPRVIDVSIQQGDVIQPDQVDIVIQFDEQIDVRFDPIFLDVLLLPQIAGFSDIRPAFVNYDPVESVLTLRFHDVSEDLYQLRLDSGTFGAEFHDLADNALDGETPVWPIPPNVSGNGIAGGDFFVNFEVDRVIPAPIIKPQRALSFAPLASTSFNNQGLLKDATDTDPFSVFLQTGQSLSAVLTPVYEFFEELFTLSGPGVSATAAAPGEPVTIHFTHTGPAGQVVLTVGGVDPTIDYAEYRLDIYIDTALEQTLAPAVGGLSPAMDLGPAFVGVPGSDVDVANVRGELDGVNPDTYAFDLQAGQAVTLTLDNEDSGATAELIDAVTGAVLATGSPASPFEQVIVDFVAPATGRYDVRITATSVSDYQLTVTRGAGINLESNGVLPSLDDAGAALGSLRELGPERLFILDRSIDFTFSMVVELDPETLLEINRFSIAPIFGDNPPASFISYDGQNLYLRPMQFSSLIYVIDPDSGALRGSWDLSGVLNNPNSFPSDIATYHGDLVVPDGTGNLLFIAPDTQAVVRQIPVDFISVLTEIAGGGSRGSLFLQQFSGDTQVIEIDALTGQALNTITLDTGGFSSARGLAFVNGRLYSALSGGESITEFDPDTGERLSSTGAPRCCPTIFGGDGVVPIQDADRYTLSLLPGEGITLSTSTPFDHPAGLPLNGLDPAVRVLDPNGIEVAFNDNGAADGKNALLTFTAVAGGVYTVEVLASDGTGEYLLDVDRAPFLFGDLTGDGFVGIEDLNLVLGKWNQAVPVGDLAQGDASGDGFIGIEDLNAVLGNWNATLSPPAVEGDLTGDGFVGIEDLNLVLGNWNTDGSADTRSDPTGDGFVGIEDLNLVLGNWNTGTPPAVQSARESQTDPVSVSLQSDQSEPAITTEDASSDTIPLASKPSILDQVVRRGFIADAPIAPTQLQVTAAWNWLNDNDRGLRTVFGFGDDDRHPIESALALARPVSEHSAVSRLG